MPDGADGAADREPARFARGHFRALKLWFVIRSYGVSGLRERIAKHIALAQDLAKRVAAEKDFEVLSPAKLALFNFRYRPEGMAEGEALDALNEALITALNDSGALYLTQNRIGGAFTIRFSVGQTYTEQRHVDAAWDRIRETARALPLPQ